MANLLPSVNKVYRFSKYESIDDLQLGQDPVPTPGSGEVLLKIHAVALNYRDVMIARGEYPFDLLPTIVPICDAAGEVVALGPNASKFTIGDRVMPNCVRDWIWGDVTLDQLMTVHGGAVNGFLQQYAVVPEYALVRIPEGWTYEEGATMPGAGVTAYNALMGGRSMKGGDTVVVQGTGGVSVFALQIAAASGATVIVTSSSDAKLQIAKSLGAHHLINYITTPDWDKEVMRLTNGKGADYIVEVGGPGTLKKSLECVRYCGTIAVVGAVATQGDPGEVAPLVLRKGVHFRGVLIGGRQQFEELCRLFEATGKRPVVDTVFRFEEAREAIRHLESQKHVGKVVIRVA